MSFGLEQGHKEYSCDDEPYQCKRCNDNNWLEDSSDGDLYCVTCHNNSVVEGTINYLYNYSGNRLATVLQEFLKDTHNE